MPEKCITSKSQVNSLTIAYKEFHLTHCKLETVTELVHQYFLSVEVNTDADIPATYWLSMATWWDCSNNYIWITCSWWIPDIKVIWYSIESQLGKASMTVTVVVQCDGSQEDSCGEYEQQLRRTLSNLLIIILATLIQF